MQDLREAIAKCEAKYDEIVKFVAGNSSWLRMKDCAAMIGVANYAWTARASASTGASADCVHHAYAMLDAPLHSYGTLVAIALNIALPQEMCDLALALIRVNTPSPARVALARARACASASAAHLRGAYALCIVMGGFSGYELEYDEQELSEVLRDAMLCAMQSGDCCAILRPHIARLFCCTSDVAETILQRELQRIANDRNRDRECHIRRAFARVVDTTQCDAIALQGIANALLGRRNN